MTLILTGGPSLTIIPDISNPTDLDRYAYVRNNPVNFNDPDGHRTECGTFKTGCDVYEAYESAKLWQQVGLSFREFAQGYESYSYFMANLVEALEAYLLDLQTNDNSDYYWVDTYSEYVKW